MICSIIGCGESATEWKGEGYSIGVNDVWKYGLITDRLIIVNGMRAFPDRLKIILHSTPKDGLYSHINGFCHHPNYKYIGSMQRWKGNLKEGILYHAASSPFIAVSMAHNIGFNEIVLYGCDMTNHKTLKNNTLKREIMAFETFSKELGKVGTKVYLGVDFGALKDTLPLWSTRF